MLYHHSNPQRQVCYLHSTTLKKSLYYSIFIQPDVRGGVIYEIKTVGVKISDDQELTCGLSGVYEMSLSSGSACIKELPVSQQHAPAFPAQMIERTSKSFARH